MSFKFGNTIFTSDLSEILYYSNRFCDLTAIQQHVPVDRKSPVITFCFEHSNIENYREEFNKRPNLRLFELKSFEDLLFTMRRFITPEYSDKVAKSLLEKGGREILARIEQLEGGAS